MATAEMQEETKSTLNFNGIEYPLDELTEEQHYLVAQIQDIENQLRQLNSREHQARIAKEGFVELLGRSLQPEEAGEG